MTKRITKKTSTVYKLTDNEGWTRKGHPSECQWGENVTHIAKGPGNSLCTSGVIHAYLSPELAVLLNPVHGDIRNPRLWLAETVIIASEGQLKVGGKSLKTIREIPLPAFTDRQKAIFALLCVEAALSKVKSPNTKYEDYIFEFNTWKEKYLKGDITGATAWAAWAAWAAARAAWAAARAAAWAAKAAAEAAAWAAEAAKGAAWAAGAAAWAAKAAEGAAAGAAALGELDLVGIAKRALEYN